MKSVHKVNLNFLILVVILSLLGGLQLRERHIAVPVIVRVVTEPTPEVRRAPASVSRAREVVLPPPAYERELHRYLSFSRKVRTTAEERRHHEHMLKNVAFIKSLQEVLGQTPTSVVEVDEQKAALAFLVEALHTGDSEVAAEVLRSVEDEAELEDLRADARLTAAEHESDELSGLTPAPAEASEPDEIFLPQSLVSSASLSH